MKCNSRADNDHRLAYRQKSLPTSHLRSLKKVKLVFPRGERNTPRDLEKTNDLQRS